MVSILDLPSEVSLLIFKYILVADAVVLLRILQNESWPQAAPLLSLMYQRLFGEGISVINTIRPVGAPHKKGSTLFDIKALPVVLRGSDPSHVAFRNIKSQFVEFNFVRDSQDNEQYFRDLVLFNALLEEYKHVSRSNAVDFFDNAPPITFYLDGLLAPPVNPRYLSFNVLAIIINLAAKEKVAQNIVSFTIIRTDLGHLFVDKWGKLLKGFTNISNINLSNNRISLDALRELEWPPKMKLLILDGNQISQFPIDIVEKLPKSLEVLQLMGTELTEVGKSMPSTFKIAEKLPNLKCLKLSYCPRLNHVEPDMFRDLTVPSFTLEVIQSPLTPRNELQLEEMATAQDQFDVVFNQPSPVTT